MIHVAMSAGEFYYPQYKRVSNLQPLLGALKEGYLELKKIKKIEIIDFFQEYSDVLRKNPFVNRIEGVIFLSAWLKRSNFIQIVEKNFKNLDYLEHFVGDKKKIKAQPRGIASHWIAGNVPTLGLFSLFQSLFVGNINILRIPPASHDIVIKLLKVFSELKTDSGLSGRDLLKSASIIYYDKSELKVNEELSEIADVRIVWGGEEAVKAISNLSKRSHCEDIIFGPKYSFSVFDTEAIESNNFLRYIRFLVNDIILFDQAACTSPHTVFFEKSSKSLKEITNIMAEQFRKTSRRFPKTEVNQFITTKIINIRAEYALDPSKSVFCDKENDWTILLNNELALEEPIESRTIFVKEIDSIMQTVPLITKKIQTIGCAIENKTKLIEFADQVTFNGVARCVNLGQMHLFDSPWDGMLFLSRLVNWTTLYYGT
ncbi:MAG: acyl-CoA reductase [Candidatus Hermodarchaeota archaeon]